MYQCFVLSVWATKFYMPIYLIRIDERTGDIAFIAGEGTVISINAQGKWESQIHE
jgi:hypothetical protein